MISGPMDFKSACKCSYDNNTDSVPYASKKLLIIKVQATAGEHSLLIAFIMGLSQGFPQLFIGVI